MLSSPNRFSTRRIFTTILRRRWADIILDPGLRGGCFIFFKLRRRYCFRSSQSPRLTYPASSVRKFVVRHDRLPTLIRSILRESPEVETIVGLPTEFVPRIVRRPSARQTWHNDYDDNEISYSASVGLENLDGTN
jgi:hypothetical protein